MKIPKGESEVVNWRTDNAMLKENGQKNKQWSTKYYTESYRLSNINCHGMSFDIIKHDSITMVTYTPY